MPIVVSYKNRKYPIDYFGISPATVPLSNLLDRVADATRMPTESLKLFYNGAIMRDPNASLAAYGISENSKILAIASTDRLVAPHPPPPTTSSSSQRLDGMLSHETILNRNRPISSSTNVVQVANQLENILTDVQVTLKPLIEKLENDVNAYLTDGKVQLKDIKYSHAFIAEGLMKILFKLDGVVVDDDSGRSKRRETVKIVQGWLDKADGLIAKVKTRV